MKFDELYGQLLEKYDGRHAVPSTYTNAPLKGIKTKPMYNPRSSKATGGYHKGGKYALSGGGAGARLAEPPTAGEVANTAIDAVTPSTYTKALGAPDWVNRGADYAELAFGVPALVKGGAKMATKAWLKKSLQKQRPNVPNKFPGVKPSKVQQKLAKGDLRSPLGKKYKAPKRPKSPKEWATIGGTTAVGTAADPFGFGTH